MAASKTQHIAVTAVAALAALLSIWIISITAFHLSIFPELEVTLANDGESPIWYTCQMTDKGDSLYLLQPNTTYRFSFVQLAFPMRWCYLYINPNNHGFFWAYTVRSRCTKCFWSIDKHPSLYRGDKGRWERQKLFMPSDFQIEDYVSDDKLLDKAQLSV